VTHLAGTTRDTVEEAINIKGIPVRVIDTAGVMRPKDLIAKKAVARSRRYIRSADLVILVLDGSRPLNKEDRDMMKNINKQKTIAVINKIDLRQKIQKGPLEAVFKLVIPLSAKRRTNISVLEEGIFDFVYQGRASVSEPALVSNLRHIEALKKAEKLIAEALNSLDNKMSLEFAAQGVKDAVLCLEELLGKRFSEDLLDKIFGEFCIGK
jgi:tRNA modification GTPase